MATNTEALLNTFGKMTLLELSEFIKAFEKKFDVTAVAPVAVTQVQQTVPEPEVEEQSEFTVILEAVGDKKIQVIKEVRSITKLGLSEAKGLVDSLPNPVLENVDRDRAMEAKLLLEKVGATVTLR